MLEADLKMEDSNKIADARNVREFIKNWRPE